MRQSHRTLGAGERCVLVGVGFMFPRSKDHLSSVHVSYTAISRWRAYQSKRKTHTHIKIHPPPRSPEEAEDIAVALSFRRTNILNPCEITLLRLLREIFQFRPRVSLRGASFRGARVECAAAAHYGPGEDSA
jgi:hypothetical protein